MSRTSSGEEAATGLEVRAHLAQSKLSEFWLERQLLRQSYL